MRILPSEASKALRLAVEVLSLMRTILMMVRLLSLPGHACASCSGDSETNDVDRFNDAVQIAYEQVVLWRRNLFNILYGSSGAKFVDELAALIHGFTGLLPSKRTSWKAVYVACHVLLQKPTSAGSNVTHSQHLERRLGLWRSDRFPVLPEESACIQ